MVMSFSLILILSCLTSAFSYPDNCGKPVISPDVPEFEESNGRIIHGTEVFKFLKVGYDVRKFFPGSSPQFSMASQH